MTIVPINFDEAALFVSRHHRHHKPPLSHKFSIAVADECGTVRGVAIVGRPISRHQDDGWTMEVLRVATDGTQNACSMLYSRARRVTFALGYRRLITYILQTEPGTSLKAAGWRLIGERKGGRWSRQERPRVDDHPTIPKLLWEAPSSVSSPRTVTPDV